MSRTAPPRRSSCSPRDPSISCCSTSTCPTSRAWTCCAPCTHAPPRPIDVIAVTAARDPETIRQAIAHGVSQYLVKPFAFATFADKLERYARYRAQVDDTAEPDQAEVDALLGTLRGPTARSLPKGLNATTLDNVRDAVREARTPLTASEVGGRCGLSRVTARRYLEHLAVEGIVTLSMRYGGTGRPEHLYDWPA